MTDLVVLGTIVRAQGLRGQVRVNPSGVRPALTARLDEARLFLRSGDVVRETALRKQRWHRGVWIIGMEDCRTRTMAEDLVGYEVCLAEEDRPDLEGDEFYDDELIGLQVLDAHTDEPVGEVTAIQPGAAADLLEVRTPGGGWFYLPAVKAMITEVDLASGTLRVDLPEGLVEINE